MSMILLTAAGSALLLSGYLVLARRRRRHNAELKDREDWWRELVFERRVSASSRAPSSRSAYDAE